MALGGKRPGAGRPKGSATTPRLRDFYTEKELAEFVASLKVRAQTDSVLAKFVAEQIFGKAPQPISGDPDNRTPIPLLNVLNNDSDKKGRSAS